MKITNTTIQNRSKSPRLMSEHIAPIHSILHKNATLDFLNSLLSIKETKETILYNIGKQLVDDNNVYVKKFLSEYNLPELNIKNIPKNEFDLLGIVYQFLNTKFENLEKGSFYTNKMLAEDMVQDLSFTNGEIIFDPSCGSGAFLFASKAKPHQIIGVDSDKIAVMIAKFNYFMKFPKASYPQIYHSDFFEWYKLNSEKKFAYIIGNPPYGANIELSNIENSSVLTGESFSYFIEYGFRLLDKDGCLRYLIPEALLNVKRHIDIRDFILEKTNLTKIKKYNSKFAGVMSDIYQIELDKKRNNNMIFITETETSIPKKIFRELKNHIFSQLHIQDIQIINKVKNICKTNLSNSIFGLGVVTGDNKTKLLSQKIKDSEHIYSGKEVDKYFLQPAKNYLVFNRSNLQQVAPDEIYRAKEKLVYKTISKKLKVAIDRTGSLTMNSANILIPKVKQNTIESVASLLNSDLYSYLNIKLFGGVNKVARENLEQLPIPFFSREQLRKIRNLIKKYVIDNNDKSIQRYIHKEIFNLTDLEIRYIKSVL